MNLYQIVLLLCIFDVLFLANFQKKPMEELAIRYTKSIYFWYKTPLHFYGQVAKHLAERNTSRMSKYTVINLKTDPELKKRAAAAADKLGISISAVLNNELRRFSVQQSVVFDAPKPLDTKSTKILSGSKKENADS